VEGEKIKRPITNRSTRGRSGWKKGAELGAIKFYQPVQMALPAWGQKEPEGRPSGREGRP